MKELYNADYSSQTFEYYQRRSFYCGAVWYFNH